MKNWLSLILLLVVFYLPLKAVDSCSNSFTYTSNQLEATFNGQYHTTFASAFSYWEFGDGATSDNHNPSHIYSAAGDYVVTYRFSSGNSNGIDSCVEFHTETITVANQVDTCKVNAFFQISQNNNIVEFHNASTSNGATTYKWIFGDGTFSNNKNVAHHYAPGNYTARLIVKNIFNGDTCESDHSVQINVEASTTPPDSCFVRSKYKFDRDPNMVRFFSESVGTGNLTYKWDFGDGKFSNDANPVHQYPQGTYVVCLTTTAHKVNNITCSDTYCDTIFVPSAGGDTCKAQAQFQPEIHRKNAFFHNTSGVGGKTLKVEWTFGDGSSSNVWSPKHEYADTGVYNVCLKITTISASGDTCRDEICKNILIKESTPECDAYFESHVSGNKVYLKNKSFPKTTNTRFDWHIYKDNSQVSHQINNNPEPIFYAQEEGTYTICLLMYGRNAQGDTCMDEYCESIIIKDIFRPDSMVCVFGYVYHDQNSNGAKDSTDHGLSQFKVKVTPGNFIVNTQPNGFYKVYLPYDSVYEIEVITRDYYVIQTEPTNRPDYRVKFSAAGQCKGNFNFGLKRDPNVLDVAVHLASGGGTRPGFAKDYKIIYKNLGTLTANGQVKFVHDSKMDFVASIPAALSYDASTRIAKWDYSNLLPGEERVIVIKCRMDSNAALGSTVKSIAVIEPQEDANSSNNIDVREELVTGSYDPNDKAVQPLGVGAANYIGLDPTLLTYTIRFQNTGTDTAFNVRIEDSIDTKLDISTLNVIAASHNYSYDVNENRLVAFYFNNILLPDSNVDEENSHGFIVYTIVPLTGLVQGDEIENTAYIFFDFNQPIITNTTLSTIGSFPASLAPKGDNNLQVTLFPNPMKQEATLSFDNEAMESFQFNLVDLTGKTVMQLDNITGNKLSIPRNNLPSGIYFYSLRANESSASGKLIVY